MFYTIGEPDYKTSNWYKDIMEGLLSEKRQKRFSLTTLGSIEELTSCSLTTEDIIFVIGTNSQWLEKILPLCESLFNNRVIVLANHENRFSKGKYSIVTADITHSVQLLYNYLKHYGKTRIAMYGINPKSSSDAYRKRSFLLCGGQEIDLFYNTISLSQCYDDFSERTAEFDAVICVNDYAAISLIRHLDDPTQLFITSCGAGTLLSQFFTPSITHTRYNYTSFGKAGVDLCKILQKNTNANSVNIYLSSEFVPGDTTRGLPLVEETMAVSQSTLKNDDKYYADFEIDEMIRVETLLSTCDKVDLQILRAILEKKTYCAIAEELFMSVNGIKYKLKNMLNICSVNTKTEFIELLGKYVSFSQENDQ